MKKLALASLVPATVHTVSAATASAAAIADKLKTIDQVAAAGPFSPNWESLGQYHIPE